MKHVSWLIPAFVSFSYLTGALAITETIGGDEVTTGQILPAVVEHTADDRIATFNLSVEGQAPFHVFTLNIQDVQVDEKSGDLTVIFYRGYENRRTVITLPGRANVSDLDVRIIEGSLPSSEKKPVINMVVKSDVKTPGCVTAPEYGDKNGEVITCTVGKSSAYFVLALWAAERLSANPAYAREKFMKAGFVPQNPFKR